MATPSGTQHVVADDELLNVFEALPSDFSDFGDSDSDIYDSDNNEESGDCENEQQATSSTQPRKRARMASPLFQWSTGDFTPQPHSFNRDQSGISVDISDDFSVLDFFQLFFPPHFVQHIANETNKYYTFLSEKVPPTPNSRLQKWKNVTQEELYIFFGVTLLMARVKKLSIAESWSKHPLLETPQFTHYMSRDRYLLILRMLHFNDNDTQVQGERLYKLKPVIDHLRNKFSEVFKPFRDICIDESLVLFKGRLQFLQYIPSKRHRFGIKLFVMCDCETGYVIDFIVYTGATTDILPGRDFGISGAVVQTFMDKYLGKGHNVWLDNWYSSPLLFDWLHKFGTNACGTVRKNRKEMPKLISKLKKGELESSHTNNVIALRWMDRREVCMLSTMHTTAMKNSRKVNRATNSPVKKPECVLDYNSNMGAVDRSDMILSSLHCLRKSLKWYRKFFFHLLDIVILNSQTLYNVKTGKNTSLAEFQLKLITEIFKKYHIQRATTTSGRRSAGEQPLRLTERHFPSPVPPTPKKAHPTRHCHVCSNTSLGEKKRRESRYMCAKCGVALCVHPCFENYHTLSNF